MANPAEFLELPEVRRHLRDKFQHLKSMNTMLDGSSLDKVFLTGEVTTMLSFKPGRMLLVAAVVGAMTQASYAGCNCSVPPSPVYTAPMAAPVSAGPAVWPGATGYANSPGGSAGTAYSSMMNGFTDYEGAGPHWAPGGYEGRVGSPAYYHDPAGGEYVVTGNPDYDHFGPGFQRNSLHGHYRYPYYNYRTPWYYPGRAVYNRNTNFAW